MYIKMNSKEFFEVHNELRAECESVLGIKGTEYPSDDGDRLSNFKEVAVLLAQKPEEVCLTYMLKHILSLCTFVRENRRDEVGREPIIGRLADIQNYCDLLLAILKEQGRVGPLAGQTINGIPIVVYENLEFNEETMHIDGVSIPQVDHDDIRGYKGGF